MLYIFQMGRTALHYAGGRSDAGHYYRILTDAGADEEIKDLVSNIYNKKASCNRVKHFLSCYNTEKI